MESGVPIMVLCTILAFSMQQEQSLPNFRHSFSALLPTAESRLVFLLDNTAQPKCHFCSRLSRAGMKLLDVVEMRSSS